MLFEEKDTILGGGLVEIVDKTLDFGTHERLLDNVERGELNSIKVVLSCKRQTIYVHVPTVYEKTVF